MRAVLLLLLAVPGFAQPVVNSFSAEVNILTGETATLRWFVSQSPASVSIDHGVGSQSSLISGSVNVTPAATTTYTLTAANSGGPVTATWTVNVLSTGAYLRTSGPPSVAICGYTNTTPPVLAACGGQTPNFQIGDRIKVYGLAADDSAHDWFSNIGQKYLKITGMTDSGHFSVADIYGAAITPNAPYCSGSGNPVRENYCHGYPNVTTSAPPSGPVVAYKITLWPFASGAKGVLDAVNQGNTRMLATSTDNGLTSLVVSGGVATATFSYALDLLTQAGNSVSVWNTTAASGNLNGEHALTSVSTNSYQFATTSPDGTYTHNDACRPAGTTNCVTISQWAINSTSAPNYNAFWHEVAFGGHGAQHCADQAACRSRFDGGTSVDTNSDYAYPFAFIATYALVDRANTYHSIDNVVYFLTHPERMVGVNFVEKEDVGLAFTPNQFLEFGGSGVHSLAIVYAIGVKYLTAPQKSVLLNKIFNESDHQPDTVACDKVRPHPLPGDLLASGTAQTGGTTTSIVLAASDSAADSFYVNNAVYWEDSSHHGWGLIATYTASSKVATITTPSPYSAWAFAPTATATYQIWPTITRSGTAITGYNTRFQTGPTPIVAGDGIMAPYLSSGVVGWNSYVFSDTYFVSSVTDDAHLVTINPVDPTKTFTAVPQPFFWFKQWNATTNNDCGLCRMFRYQTAFPYGQPVQYGNSGSTGTKTFGQDMHPPTNKESIWVNAIGTMGMAAATDDQRAIYAVELTQPYLQQNDMMVWSGGAGQDGVGYTWQTFRNPIWMDRALANSIPGYPSQDPSGPWSKGVALFKVYANYPDYRITGGTSHQYPTLYGDSASEGYQIHTPGESVGTSNYVDDLSSYFLPTAAASQYLHRWLANMRYLGTGSSPGAFAKLPALFYDPRIPAVDYTTQPTQRAFIGTSKVTALALTGDTPTTSWPHYQGDVIVSQSDWTKSATQLFFEARSWAWSTYDSNGAYSLKLYKVGTLLNCDHITGTAPGGAPAPQVAPTSNQACDTPEFNGKNTLHAGAAGGYGPDIAWIDRWAGAGNSDPLYGDASKRYAYARANLTDSYWTRYNRVAREVIHFKKPGTEEIIVDRWDIDASNAPAAPQIRTQVHYPQNLEVGTLTGNGTSNGAAYTEGDTSCPGSGGCPSLNTSRTVLEQEDGHAADANPARVYNLVTKFVAPSDAPITLRWDGTAFTGSQGHSYRVSVCAGSSCGGTATRTDYLTIHKIAPQPDTTLNVTTLSAGSNWLVAQTTDKVAAFARGGALQTSLFTNTSFSAGTAQHLIAGLDDQYTYDVSLGGAPVLNAATVAAQDNSLYFEAGSGALSISIHGTAPRMTLLCSPPSGTTTVGVAYSAICTAAGGTAPYSWSVAGGVLPPGMDFSAAGILSGIPTTAGDYPLTVQVQDSAVPPSSAGGALALHVWAPPTPLVITVSGATASQALLLYGQLGMDALQSCAVTVSTQPDFSVITESYTDTGGAAIRPYVAGGSTSLLASTLYYLRVVCGASQGTTQFTTSAPLTPSSLSVPVSIFTPPGMNVATVQLQYGGSAQLGTSISSPCASGCLINVPATSGTVLYLKRVFLDASSQVVAESSARPILAR